MRWEQEIEGLRDEAGRIPDGRACVECVTERETKKVVDGEVPEGQAKRHHGREIHRSNSHLF